MAVHHPLPEGVDPVIIRRNWQIMADAIGKVLVSANDDTPGYLSEKLVTETPWLDDEILNPGGNEQLSHRHMDAAPQFDNLVDELIATTTFVDQEGRVITVYFYSNTHARIDVEEVSPTPSASPSPPGGG